MIISGPSGVGKSTVVKELVDRCDLPLIVSVSVTTRPPRTQERDGVDYHFVSAAEFAVMRERGDFLECCEVFGKGHWYGTPKEQVEASLQGGKWVILEIDVEGADKVVLQHPDAITVFVGLPSLAEIERRLRDRGTEDDQAIQRRLEVAQNELEHLARYQHFVINDTVDRAVNEICDILKRSGANNA